MAHGGWWMVGRGPGPGPETTNNAQRTAAHSAQRQRQPLRPALKGAGSRSRGPYVARSTAVARGATLGISGTKSARAHTPHATRCPLWALGPGRGPGGSWELGWAGCAPEPRGPNLPPGPLGSGFGTVAGDPGRHRGWPLCPSFVPAAGGRGLRPHVFSAHRPVPQLQVHAPRCPAWGVTPHLLAKRLQTGIGFLLQANSTFFEDLVLIRTGAPAQIRAADRFFGTPAVLPSIYMWPRSTTRGRPHRSARCSAITQRARMQQRPSSAAAAVSACAASCFVARSSAGQSRRKSALPYPGRGPRGCLHAGGEQRGHIAAPCRQTKWGRHREGPLTSAIGSFSHGRAAQTLGAQDFIA
jgi:hypothetical protein